MRQNARMNKQLKELEDEILHNLSASEGDILEDDKLINVISAAKNAAMEIQEKKAEAAKTEVEIDTAREAYRTVAYRTSVVLPSIFYLNPHIPSAAECNSTAEVMQELI